VASVEDLVGNPSESMVAEGVYACRCLEGVEPRWPLVASEVRGLHELERSITDEEVDQLIRQAVQRGEVSIELNENMEWCLSIDPTVEANIHRRYWYWKMKREGIEVFPLFHWPQAIETARFVVSEWHEQHGRGPTYAELHDDIDALYGDEDGAVQAVHQAIESRAIERMGDTFVLGDTLPFSWGEE
jgi:hypothetical protein